jgi:chromosome segregation ATPase
MADLGDTWNEVAEAAGAAQEAARTYQQLREDPARAEDERGQARNEYKNATKRLYEALREAKVQEHDGLWSEVLEAVEHAQAAGHTFFSSKHDLDRSEAERAQVKEAYAQAKGRLISLLVELKIVPPPEAAVPEEGKKESEVAETPEEVSEPALAEVGPEEPTEPGPPSCEAGSTP